MCAYVPLLNAALKTKQTIDSHSTVTMCIQITRFPINN